MNGCPVAVSESMKRGTTWALLKATQWGRSLFVMLNHREGNAPLTIQVVVHSQQAETRSIE